MKNVNRKLNVLRTGSRLVNVGAGDSAYLELAKLGGIEDANAGVVHLAALERGVVEMRVDLPFEAGFENRTGRGSVRVGRGEARSG
jgi:hypothetical protein